MNTEKMDYGFEEKINPEHQKTSAKEQNSDKSDNAMHLLQKDTDRELLALQGNIDRNGVYGMHFLDPKEYPPQQVEETIIG